MRLKNNEILCKIDVMGMYDASNWRLMNYNPYSCISFFSRVKSFRISGICTHFTEKLNKLHNGKKRTQG